MTTIDCRPPADYLEAHLDKSYNIPLDDLQQRSYELPPRTISFNVVCSQSQLSQCREWFLEQHSKPWPVLEFFAFETCNATDDAANTTTIVRNVQRHFVVDDPTIPLFPFHPAPILAANQKYLRIALRAAATSSATSSAAATSSTTSRHAPIQPLILDVGCGAGRDTIFLSYAFPSHQIIAIDNLQVAINRVSSFVKREQRTNVSTIKTTLAKNVSLYWLHCPILFDILLCKRNDL